MGGNKGKKRAYSRHRAGNLFRLRVKALLEAFQGTSTPAELAEAYPDLVLASRTKESGDLHFLPSLASGQRRAVHELAREAELYHASQTESSGPAGGGEPARHIVVSRQSHILVEAAAAGATTQWMPGSGDVELFLRKPQLDFRRQRPAHSGDTVPAEQRDAIKACMRECPVVTRQDLACASQCPLGSPPAPPTSDQVEWVDTERALRSMCDALRASPAVAVDLEAHNARTYRPFVCLLQFATPTRAWVVDACRLWDALPDALRPVMENPAVLKVFHAMHSLDLRLLQTDLGLFTVNAFDTQLAASRLGLPQGLAALIEALCPLPSRVTAGLLADKARYQTSDWRRRPLSADQLRYAAGDTWWLLYLFDALRERLLDAATAEHGPMPADGAFQGEEGGTNLFGEDTDEPIGESESEDEDEDEEGEVKESGRRKSSPGQQKRGTGGRAGGGLSFTSHSPDSTGSKDSRGSPQSDRGRTPRSNDEEEGVRGGVPGRPLRRRSPSVSSAPATGTSRKSASSSSPSHSPPPGSGAWASTGRGPGSDDEGEEVEADAEEEQEEEPSPGHHAQTGTTTSMPGGSDVHTQTVDTGPDGGEGGSGQPPPDQGSESRPRLPSGGAHSNPRAPASGSSGSSGGRGPAHGPSPSSERSQAARLLATHVMRESHFAPLASPSRGSDASWDVVGDSFLRYSSSEAPDDAPGAEAGAGAAAHTPDEPSASAGAAVPESPHSEAGSEAPAALPPGTQRNDAYVREVYHQSLRMLLSVRRQPKPQSWARARTKRGVKEALGGLHSDAERAVFQALWEWRQRTAKALDESPEFVAPIHLLRTLAAAMPENEAALKRAHWPLPPLLGGQCSAPTRDAAAWADGDAEWAHALRRGLLRVVREEARRERRARAQAASAKGAAKGGVDALSQDLPLWATVWRSQWLWPALCGVTAVVGVAFLGWRVRRQRRAL